MTMRTYCIPDMDAKGLAESAINYLSSKGLPSTVSYETIRFYCHGRLDKDNTFTIVITPKPKPVPPGEYRVVFTGSDTMTILDGEFQGRTIKVSE